MATTITPATLKTFRASAECAILAATADGANGKETFSFASNGRPFVLIVNVAASNGAVALEFNKGEMWGGKAISIGSAPQGKNTAFYCEPGYGAKNDGTVEIVATPASGKKLLTDHALKLSVVQI